MIAGLLVYGSLAWGSCVSGFVPYFFFANISSSELEDPPKMSFLGADFYFGLAETFSGFSNTSFSPAFYSSFSGSFAFTDFL